MNDRTGAPARPPLTPGIVWEVDYTGHPFLDPSLWDHGARLADWTRYTWERIRDDDAAYRRESARFVRPLTGRDDIDAPADADVAAVSEALAEAEVYLRSTIDLLPPGARAHVAPLDEVARCDDLRALLAMVFTGADPRRRFEAQRKLYLANLLLDIDQSRPIQDGPLHLAHVERVLDNVLWRHRQQIHEVEIGFRLDDDGRRVRYSSRPRSGDERFRFYSSFLERRDHRRRTSLDILYSNCRFKLAVLPVGSQVVDGRHEVHEAPRWSGMRQHRSGSVLSKMIRRGINDPSEIADLLGAMFVVFDEEALDELLELLDAGVGDPFGWRNVTDMFRPSAPGSPLHPQSGQGYQVFKGDVDLLVAGSTPYRPPYRVTVEFQIHTLESFLRTVCASHDASHRALKLRQFLSGLVPYLFPAPVYGRDWLRFDAER